MENKLTAAIAATYWGAECKYFDEVFIMWGLNSNRIWKANDGSGTMPIDSCKLILKPLSEISDEDAIEVAKICQILRGPATEMNIYLGRGIILWHLCEVTPWGGSKYEHLDNVKTRDIITNIQPIYFVEIINFLRKKSYDCDNLISQNIATKLK